MALGKGKWQRPKAGFTLRSSVRDIDDWRIFSFENDFGIACHARDAVSRR
jgi:hypothetical protein